MDKMLKQRLIGATILIALAVIFVPMLFEEPASLDNEQEFSMDVPPPPSGRGEIRRLPLDPARMSGPRVAEPTEPDPGPDDFDPPDLDPIGEASPDDSLINEPEEDVAQAPDLDPSSVPLEPGPEPTIEMPGDDSPQVVEEPAVEKPEPAAQIARPSVEDASAAPGDWIVQVASFSSSETAERIKNQLQQLGHKAGSDLVVRGDTRLHRIWTGPYAERADAERARSQIAATIGDVDPLIKNISGNDSEVSAADSVVPVFSVQVGSFAEKANAERQTGQMLEQGFDAFIHADASGSRPIWRVRVGQFSGREQAAALLERLRADEGLDGLIVTHP